MLQSIFQANLTHKLYPMPKYLYLQVAHDVLLMLTCTVLTLFTLPLFFPFTSYFKCVAYRLSSHYTHIFSCQLCKSCL